VENRGAAVHKVEARGASSSPHRVTVDVVVTWTRLANGLSIS
jgi:hypothetical protein